VSANPHPFSRAIVCALVVLQLYSGFIVLELRRHNYDASALIVAGDEFIDVRASPANVTVLRDSAGYDGQFYYRLALAPFSVQPRVHGIRFDYPALRQQRIGYPLVVWLLSFGQPRVVPITMILVNLAALVAIAAMGALIVRGVAPEIAGAAVALYPSFLLTITRDLVEALEVCFVLAAVLSARRGRWWPTIAFLTLAVLTKETALLAIVGIFLWTLLARQFGRAAALTIPAIVHVLWKTSIFLRWHLPMTFISDEHYALPFRTMIKTLIHPPSRLVFVEVLLLLTFMLIVAFTLRSSRAPGFVKVACVLYGVLFVCLGAEFWWEDWGFLRTPTDFGIFGTLVALHSRMDRATASLITVSWLGLAAHILLYR
jgi:hypothetical protein